MPSGVNRARTVSSAPGSGAQRDQLAGRVGQPLGVGVAVLHDQAADALGAAFGEAEADRGAEVEHVHHEPGEADPVGEAVDHVGEPVEGEGEAVGRLGVAEARVVGGDDAVAVAEHVDETAELVRGGREAVQEQQHGRVRPVRHGFAVEDAHAVDLDVAVDGAGERRNRHD